MNNAINVHILVLDDNRDTALEAIRRSLALLAGEDELLPEPPWEIAFGGSVRLRVDCTFIANPTKAREILFGGNDSLKGFQLVLLDNNWSEAGEDDDFGICTLESQGASRISHPLLAIYTAIPEHHFIVRALNAGARALVDKAEPIHLLNLLFAAADHSRLQVLQSVMLDGLQKVDSRLQTDSPAMAACLADAAAYAMNPDLPIILLGATGTGKELIAKAIHGASPRSGGPFVLLDCATLPPTLAETELFGHEKGAFTGADSAKRGVFERAHGGTLFIDELHLLPPDLQPKLLRVVESHMFQRVGGTVPLIADFRVVAAAKPAIEKMVAAYDFLPDLYSRLNYGRVEVPSLKDRACDIPRMAQSFLQDFTSRYRKGSGPAREDA
jgi:DNA-binding NtrC family response regulator